MATRGFRATASRKAIVRNAVSSSISFSGRGRQISASSSSGCTGEVAAAARLMMGVGRSACPSPSLVI
jgi:hypothetical protein